MQVKKCSNDQDVGTAAVFSTSMHRLNQIIDATSDIILWV